MYVALSGVTKKHKKNKNIFVGLYNTADLPPGTTRRQFLAPAYSTTHGPSHTAPASAAGDDFKDYWGVSRDDMILILSVCLASAFLILIMLLILLAVHHHRRRRHCREHKRRMALQAILATGRHQVPSSKRALQHQPMV